MKYLLTIFRCITASLSIAVLFVACGTSKKVNTNYLYFQQGKDTVAANFKEVAIQPNDVLSIQVFSKTINQEQAAIFNIPANNGIQQGYQVSSTGMLDMPVIGSLKVNGLTKEQLQKQLVQRLTDYVKNPSVLIRFLQFNVNVLGEVKNPGMQKFLSDRVTIIDALSAAGDLTDFGKREDVTIIREENGTKVYHKIDLRSKGLFESPVYTLQPNDVVYVGANENKLKTLSVDPAVQRRTSLFFTVLGVVVSIGTLIITASR